MKIGYLILAHDNFTQLATLIDLLTIDQVNHCFVHFDARQYSTQVRKSLITLCKSRQWTLISKRTAINWGGFSMIEATLHLMVSGLNSKIEFDYLSLHSGFDLPIKSDYDIKNFLGNNNGKNFLAWTGFPNEVWRKENGGIDRLCYHWFIDQLGYVDSCSLVDAQRTVGLIKAKPSGINRYFGGSQWWTLTRECAIYIINYINNNSEYFNFFRSSFIPDEHFFQTLLVNSSWIDTIENNNLRYIDWESGPDFPRVMTMEDVERIETTEFLFARKFNQNIDFNVIEYFKTKALEKHRKE